MFGSDDLIALFRSFKEGKERTEERRGKINKEMKLNDEWESEESILVEKRREKKEGRKLQKRREKKEKAWYKKEGTIVLFFFSLGEGIKENAIYFSEGDIIFIFPFDFLISFSYFLLWIVFHSITWHIR